MSGYRASQLKTGTFRSLAFYEEQRGKFRVMYMSRRHPNGFNYPSLAFGVLPGFYDWFEFSLPNPYIDWEFVRRLDPELEGVVRSVLGELGIGGIG